MLNFNDIIGQYPLPMRGFKRYILREYLQYKILSIISQSDQSSKLSFLGGTALCIIHHNSRFSEDLDFDNFNLSDSDFSSLIDKIRKQLVADSFEVETKIVHKGAYRCYLRFPNLLYQLSLSPLEEEKILIQVDSASHHFAYQPETVIINKFNIFAPIRVTPIDILLSQKLLAAVTRKNPKGRDFYDIVFLLSLTKPNYDYLSDKMKLKNAEQLKRSFLSSIEKFNFKDLASDVRPFLFDPKDSQKVSLFVDYFKSVDLG